MQRKYLVIGLAVVGSLAIAAPVLGGPSLSSMVKEEVAKQLANSPAQSAKSKRGPRGPAGPAGPAGTAGTAGIAGAPGATGAAGSPAASAFMGRVDGLTNTNNAIVFAYPEGLTAVPGGAEVGNRFASPNATIVLRDLFVTQVAPGGATTGRIFTLLDDGAPALGCTILGAQTSCNSAGATATVSPGSLLALKIENQGAPVGATAAFGYRATTP